MTRTYWIRHNTMNGMAFDKIVYRSVEERPNFHKVEALNEWMKAHKNHGFMTIKNVYTKQEMKANGYMN